jgi:transcriptional regulator with PAS, ATPase and Fis domain
LALTEQSPIQLVGPEHYNKNLHGWTCASAPIFSSEGKMLGCVTLSGKVDAAQIHTFGMVISAAEAIQNRLRERDTEMARQRDEQLMLRLLKTSNQAIITLSPVGEVLYLNHPAELLLGGEEGEFRGRKATDLFGAPELGCMPAQTADGSRIEMVYESGGQRQLLIGRTYVVADSDNVLGTILEVSKRRDFIKNVRDVSGFAARFHLEDIIGQHETLRKQIELAGMVAKQDCRALITGETGTGKELLVQGIHNASRRASGPFVAINCAALPRDLFEAELLGYKEGAFTSARRGGQIGKFELADGGTLFLDEISQMPYDMQAKLLRVLQDGIITRLGDTKPISIDVRVIAATNEDLFEKSKQGGFRSDLFFRLSAVELYLPPLRERGDDIVLLAETILGRLSERLQRSPLRLRPGALEILRHYDWPGNIRELENVLEMAAITCREGVIGRDDLPRRLRISSDCDAPAPGYFPSQSGAPLSAHVAPIRDVEADVIRQALNQHKGKISRVSRELGISRSTIYRRMREIGINRVFRVVGAESGDLDPDR